MDSNILGFDPSIVSSGYCYQREGKIITGRIRTKKLRGPARLQYIKKEFKSILHHLGITQVCYEGYSMGSKGGRSFNIGELGGVLSLCCYNRGIDVFIIPPKTLKKFATGNGNCDKEDMIEITNKKWGHEIFNDDEADAFCLYQLGLCLANPRNFRKYPRQTRLDLVGKYQLIRGLSF